MGEILVMVLKGLFILVALVMTFFILLQEGKGGGLAGLGGTKAAGVEGVTNPIRRATAVLSVIFFLLAILLGVMARPTSRGKVDGLFDTGTPSSTEATAPGDGAINPEEPVAVKPGAQVTPVASDALKTGDAAKVDAPATKDATEKPVEKTEPKATQPDGAAVKTDEKPAEKPVEKKNP